MVRVHDYVRTGDLHLIVMEFLGGGTLTRRRAGIPPEGACAAADPPRPAEQPIPTPGLSSRRRPPASPLRAGGHDNTAKVRPPVTAWPRRMGLGLAGGVVMVWLLVVINEVSGSNLGVPELLVSVFASLPAAVVGVRLLRQRR